MNFGLTIIAICYIVFLIVPGTFFKRFYFQSKFSKEFYKGAFADRLVTSIFWGLFIQTICLIVIKEASGLTFDGMYVRINNFYTSLQNNALPKISFTQLLYLVGMFSLSISLSCLLGHFFHKLLRYFKLDVNFSPFRFSNEWQYIFRNEVKRSDLSTDHVEKTYMTTEVDVIVNDFKEDRPSFYTGILKDFYITPSGDLDKILLGNAQKRIKDSDDKAIFTPIKGDTFIIPYSNISNINLRFNYIEKTNKIAIPKSIQQTLTLILIFLLLPILVLPWFFEATVWEKVLSTILMLISWFFIVGAILSTFDNNKKKELIPLILFILLGISALFWALSILDIFHIIDYILSLS